MHLKKINKCMKNIWSNLKKVKLKEDIKLRLLLKFQKFKRQSIMNLFQIIITINNLVDLIEGVEGHPIICKIKDLEKHLKEKMN